MKITPKKYALALYEATKDKNKNEIKDAVGNLIRIMISNRDLNKIDLVIKYFIKYWNKESGVTVVDLKTAEKIDKETSSLLNDFISDLLKVKNIEIREKVDKNILGGIIIKHEDQVYDSSLKSRVKELRNKLIK